MDIHLFHNECRSKFCINMMLIASQVAAVVSGPQWRGPCWRACSPMPTQHTVVAVTPPGDDWGDSLSLLLCYP